MGDTKNTNPFDNIFGRDFWSTFTESVAECKCTGCGSTAKFHGTAKEVAEASKSFYETHGNCKK